MSSLSIFRAGRPGVLERLPEPVQLGAVGNALLWIDIPVDIDRSSAATTLQGLGLAGFEPGMLSYLRAGSLAPAQIEAGASLDPSIETVLRRGARYRLVAAADVFCESAQQGAAPKIVVRPVHILAGPRWLLTTRRVAGVKLSVDELAARIRWSGWKTASGHDLATLMLRALVATFLPALDALASEQIAAEANWLSPPVPSEQKRVAKAGKLEDVILAMRPAIFELERETVRLLRPGTSPADGWFIARQTPADAAEIATLLEQVRARISDLLDAQRGTLQLVAGVIAAEQLTTAEAARERAEGLEGLVAWLTALVLVPTLVAGIFSALPQIYENESSKRTILVVAVTAASTLLAGLVAYCKRSRSK